MPGTDTIEMYQGEDIVLPFAFSGSEDITGWSIAFTVRGSGAALITKTTAQGGGVSITQASPPATYAVTLADTDTDALPPGPYRYDCWRTDSGSERVLAIGLFRLLPVARAVTP